MAQEKIKLQKVLFHVPRAVYGQTTSYLPNAEKKRLGPLLIDCSYLPDLEVIEVCTPDPQWPDLLIPVSSVWQMQREQEKKDPPSGPEVLSQAQKEALKAQAAVAAPVQPAPLPEGARSALSAPLPPEVVKPPPKKAKKPEADSEKPTLTERLDGKLKKKRGRPKKAKKDETD